MFRVTIVPPSFGSIHWSLPYNDGFRNHECKEIARIAEMHLDALTEAWYQTFGKFES